MYYPTYGLKPISQYGYATLSGTSNPEIVTYPRSRGALVRPSKIVEKNINLNCVWIFGSNATMSDVESYQHRLMEHFSSSSKSTLTINGLSIENCAVNDASVSAVKAGVMFYTVDISIGQQHAYPEQGEITHSQFSGYPTLGAQRSGTFTPEGSGPFTLGQRVEKFHNAKFEVTQDLPASWAIENRIKHNGGTEEIRVRGWITNETRQALMTFAYNVINGPLGKIGTLSIGGNTTQYAVMRDFSMEPIKGGSMYWDATFITSLQC